ncbi:MAG: hypothetical protein AAFZ15_08345 [Bacteroidota bacterium]
MTKSEKRYFKVFCGQSTGNNNYLRLFAALDEQEVFDEAVIRKKFKGEKFLQQLHVTKNYLRKLILKSLRNYHGKISKDAELKAHLLNLEVLYNRELYQHCLTELKRAEFLATTYELKTGTIEVINWKRKLEQAIRPQNYRGFQAIVEEQASAIDNLKNVHDYWKLAIEVSSGLFEGGGKKEVVSPLLTDAKMAKSLEAKVLFYNSRYVYFLQKEEQDKAVKALEELVEYMEGIPSRLREDPAMYVSSVNNLVSYYFFTKDLENALGLINRSKNFYQELRIKGDKKSLLKQILRSHNIELEIYRTHHLFHENMPFILEIEKFVMENRAKMPVSYRLSFWFQFAYIHFMEREFDVTLKWVNLILNNKSKNIRTDLLVQTRMLNLMTHLEQKNYFVMRYFVDSTRRFMKKVKGVKPYEKVLLQFFSRMGRVPEFEWKENFLKLKNELAGSEDFANDLDLLINYNWWIEKHL